MRRWREGVALTRELSLGRFPVHSSKTVGLKLAALDYMVTVADWKTVSKHTAG